MSTNDGRLALAFGRVCVYHGRMRITERKSVTVQEFDKLVVSTYGRPYSFQQQDGCKFRGVEHVSVPATPEDYEATECEERVNCNDFGVSFAAWLARDPDRFLSDGDQTWLARFPKAAADNSRKSSLATWWERHFYPHVSMVVNDLHARGLLPAGEYTIEIDW